jgi:hypothetical protein
MLFEFRKFFAALNHPMKQQQYVSNFNGKVRI